jgi:hypothetical protein
MPGLLESYIQTAKFNTATKTKPGLWEQAKRTAVARMGGKHSARAMQLATKIYKDKGGGYKGKKTRSNSMVKWTKQKWRTADGGKSYRKTKSGRTVVKKYLPSAAWEDLSKSEVKSLNRSKQKAFREGKQFSSSPRKLTKKISRYWQD